MDQRLAGQRERQRERPGGSRARLYMGFRRWHRGPDVHIREHHAHVRAARQLHGPRSDQRFRMDHLRERGGHDRRGRGARCKPAASNQGPGLRLSHSTFGLPGETITFNLTANDTEGDPLYITWDFGDSSGVAVNYLTNTQS